MYCMHIVFSLMDLPVVFINGSMMLIVLIVVGISLVMGRFLVIEYAPWVGAHSEAIAAMLDLELSIIEGTVDMVYVGVQVIFDVISLLSGHKPHMHLPTWHKNLIDPSEVVSLTHELSYRCSAYDTFDRVILSTSRSFGSPFVCPLLRHTYPSRTLYSSMEPLFGWLSYDPKPAPFGGNCEAPYGTSTDVACVAFGSGYIVLELLLPLYIVLLVGQTGLWTNIIGLLVSLCVAAWEAVREVALPHLK